jgi:hypothetical protein
VAITRFAVVSLTLATTLASPLAEGADTPPAWAYPIAPADLTGPDDGVPRRVPNSSVAYTLTQLRDRFIASDWHPEGKR